MFLPNRIPWQVHIIFSQSDSQQVEDVLLKDKDPGKGQIKALSFIVS